MRRTQRSSQRSAVSADSRQTCQTSLDTAAPGSGAAGGGGAGVDQDKGTMEEGHTKARTGSKKSANLVIDLENIKVNGTNTVQSGQFLETPKQSPEVEPPIPSIVTESEGKEKQERLSARDRLLLTFTSP